MKMIEELYQEVLENDAMKQEFAEATQDGRIMEFLKKHGCEAETEEVNAFLKEQQEKEGELSDAELEAVSGGCSSGGPAPNSHLEQRWDQEGSYTVIVCDEWSLKRTKGNRAERKLVSMEGKMLFHHMIHDLKDWRQVFQDPDAFEPLIREIFRRHGLSFAGIGRCAPGSNAVFHCGGYIVKIFAPEESGIGGRDDFLTEKFGLLRAKRLSVPAPVLYAEGVIEDAHTFRYLLLEYVEGESLAGLSPRLSGGERFRIGRRLREIVDRMDVACEPFNSHALFGRAAEERWKAFPASFRRERETYLRQRYGGGRTAVYVHGDLNPDNILIRPDGRLCLIDFADAMRAPIELELASLLCDGFRFDADYLAGFLDAKKVFRQETFRNAAREKESLKRENMKKEGRREEKLAESLLFGLLIHDYGVNIIRDNIGAPERIPSLKTLRERLDYALLTGTQTS